MIASKPNPQSATNLKSREYSLDEIHWLFLFSNSGRIIKSKLYELKRQQYQSICEGTSSQRNVTANRRLSSLYPECGREGCKSHQLWGIHTFSTVRIWQSFPLVVNSARSLWNRCQRYSQCCLLGLKWYYFLLWPNRVWKNLYLRWPRNKRK